MELFTGLLLVLSLITIDPDGIYNYSTGTTATSDGSYVITGSFYRSDSFVTKVSSNGSLEWTTVLKSTGQISSIVETDDEYVVVGYWPFVSVNKHPRGFGFIAALEKDGKFKLGRSFEKGNYSEFHKVIQTQDGNFITVGLVGNGDSEDGWVVKVSPRGKTLWYRSMDGGNTTDVFEDVKEVAKGEYLIFGTSDDRPTIATVIEKENGEIDMVDLFLGY